MILACRFLSFFVSLPGFGIKIIPTFFLHLFLFFQLLFKYSCLHFLPKLSATPHPPPYTLNPFLLWFCSWVLYTSSLMTLPFFSPVISLPHPLWLLSVCSLFQYLWLYFFLLVCFVDYVTIIGRSYGICLSLPGLSHLVQCSPVPSMLS